ncbi:hypothetical protein I3760_09G165200 [Carya illinoinensis]|nr:hypothetical protein I3760_09G165200 [Carya illinoinensis]
MTVKVDGRGNISLTHMTSQAQSIPRGIRNQLTASHSTTELLRNNRRLDLIDFNSSSQPMINMSLKFPS